MSHSSTATHSAHTTAKNSAQHTTSSRTTATSSHKTGASARSKKIARGSKTAKKRGQQAIDSERARQIQQALIREHYLSGEPSGSWDSSTQAAMQKYQLDQGWQSKTTPDSRALIKLGLGPSHDHLLNPETAMTSSTAPASPADPSAADPKSETKQASPARAIPQQ